MRKSAFGIGLFVAIILGILMSGSVVATTDHTVYAWVYDDDTMENVADASIEVYDFENDTLLNTYQTNESGFAVMNLPSGDYLLKVKNSDDSKSSVFRLVLTDGETDTTISLPVYSESGNGGILGTFETHTHTSMLLGIIAVLSLMIILLIIWRYKK